VQTTVCWAVPRGFITSTAPLPPQGFLVGGGTPSSCRHVDHRFQYPRFMSYMPLPHLMPRRA